MRKSVFSICALIFFLLFSSVSFAEIPGKYRIILPHCPPEKGSCDQVEIVEIFSFSCPHCYDFFFIIEPELKKRFGDKIKITHYPVDWSDSDNERFKYDQDLGRFLFIAKDAKKENQYISSIFKFYFDSGIQDIGERNKLSLVAKMLKLEKEYKTSIDSPEIIEKMNNAILYADNRNIDSTPTLVIADAIIPNSATDIDNLSKIIDYLLKEAI